MIAPPVACLPETRAAVRRARGRIRFALACVLAGCLAAGSATGTTLHDNGPVTDVASDGRCDSGPSLSCGGSGLWTFFDDFRLTADATLTGFDYTDWFLYGSPADYVATDWSLFDADPFTSVPLASGTVAAVLTPLGPPDLVRFTVTGLDLDLLGGVHYWLGIHNAIQGAAVTTVARVGNPGSGLDAAKQSDGAGNDIDLPVLENRAFRLHGTFVPEPSTALLVALGLPALGARRPRCRR